MKNIETCAGCFLLFKKTNNGNPFVYCYLNKPTQESKKNHLDRRLDIEVPIMPVEKCKVRSGSEYIKKHLTI